MLTSSTLTRKMCYPRPHRSEEHTSELQSPVHLVDLHSFPTRRSSDLLKFDCKYGWCIRSNQGMKEETNNEMDLLLRRLGRRGDTPTSDTKGDVDHLDADELNAYAENVLPAAAQIGRAHV